MNLFINSPSYYTREYGVDDEVYKFYSYLSKHIDVTCYTDCLDTIGIVPMIAPRDVLAEINWKKRVHVSQAYRMADVSLSADFEKYHFGNFDIRKQVILENLFESMMCIRKRLGKNFNYEMMKRDLEQAAKAYEGNVFRPKTEKIIE